MSPRLGSLRRAFTVEEALARGYRVALIGPQGNILSVHQDEARALTNRGHYKNGKKILKMVKLEDLK